MTPEQAKKLLPIIKAFSEGKKVQFQNSFGRWEYIANPSFYDANRYRIKPEPREVWLYESHDAVQLSMFAHDGWKKIKFVEKED